MTKLGEFLALKQQDNKTCSVQVTGKYGVATMLMRTRPAMSQSAARSAAGL